MSIIQPPARTTRAGTILVIILIVLFTLRFHITSLSVVWTVAAMAILTATAFYLRADPAVHPGLLGVLILVAASIPFLRDLWPLSGAAAVCLYAAIVLPSKRLRTFTGWARRGRIQLGDILLIAIIAVLTAFGIWGWIKITQPDLSDLVATVPDTSVGFLVLFGLLFAVVNSFFEEVLYRGVFMYALEAAFGSLSVALFGQALFFGLLHIQGFPSGASGMVLAGLFGLLLGYLRIRTRGMLAPWITHALVNGMMYAFLASQAIQATQMAALPNPSFEQVDSERREERPAQWRGRRWGGRGEFVHALSGHTGGRSVMLFSTVGGDISWSTTVQVIPFSRYRLSGWIKTEGVVPTTGRGALINLHGMTGAESNALTGTCDWTQVAFEFESGSNDAVQINCLFGGWGLATGRAWFDDLALELLETRKLQPAVSINASETGAPISHYIYGQFIEHLGRCIYGGIWAEMLEDRKFWYAPGEEASPWSIIGDPDAFSLDEQRPYVGQQTPVVSLPGDGEHHGLSHGSLAVEAGREYTGRIVLSGDGEAAPVEVSLVWGNGSGDRETVTIESIGSVYTKIPLRFASAATSGEGRLEITSRGRGALRIGTVSLMPEDNVEGFRRDVLELLRELDAPVYRWPGGNFVSGYDWKDGIGDPDRRPPRKNPAWQGIEHNDVGIHEFIQLCELIDTDPYVTVNTGQGSAEMATEEVEYCNGSADTPMGRLRAENGHPEPFNVHWWAVGNEMYGRWQLGYMPLDQYVQKHNSVVDAMRAVDPEISVVAVGSVGRWDETMMRECADHMDLISEHFYCQERPGLLGHSAWAAEHVRRISDAHRQYRENFQELEGRDIRIALDEWNYWYGPYVYGELGTRYFLKDALGIARGLHEYYRNSDIIFMANYAQTVNVIGCIKTTKTRAAFATTGLVLKLYRQEYGQVPVEVTGNPEPLDVTAAWTDDRSALTVAVVNPTHETIRIPVEIQGAEPTGSGRSWLITGPDEYSYNEPGGRTEVTIVEQTFRQFPARLRIPPMSITLYRLDVR